MPPTSDSFSMSEEDPLDTDMYSFDFFERGAGNDSLARDAGYMDFELGDGGDPAIYNGSGYAFDTVKQPSQAVLAAEKPGSLPLSHRGSMSSSSSRTNCSNSPHTSAVMTSVDVSPSEWFDDIGGHESLFSMDQAIDISQFVTLPDSDSPDVLFANEIRPELDTFGEPQAQGRAVKRRKAQSDTQAPPNRTINKAKAKDTRETSPSLEHLPEIQMVHPAAFPNKASPVVNVNHSNNVFDGMGMPTAWTPAANNQLSYPQLQSNAGYISPANQDSLTGNVPALLTHSALPRLVIHPMPAKSRVETQIPLKITLHQSPKGIKKVHLPTHTISKPKLLQKPSTGPSADTLELTTMLVCTSAMNDPANLKRAFARAAGKSNTEELTTPIEGLKDEDDQPQNGGEVRICPGCITRERKRAGRKKHKKPEEEQLWDRYEAERAIVFNTQEVKEWQPVTALMADPTGAGFINGSLPEGSMQVDAPMRIACYCRHHSEKAGFQVIITLKDCVGNFIAQGISSSIMITDDHKTPTHVGPGPLPAQQPSQSQHPITSGPALSSQGGVTQPMPVHVTSIQPRGVHHAALSGLNSEDTPSLPFRQTHTNSDLQNLKQASPLAITPTTHPNNAQKVSAATTPRNPSRQTSPASPMSTGSRKRKASVAAKFPAGLVMTRIETNHSVLQPMPSGAYNDSAALSKGTSPFSTGASHLPQSGERSNQGQQHMPNSIPKAIGGGPTTPNGIRTEPFLFGGINNRAMSLERPVSQLFSAPASAHPSRAPSPNQLRSDIPNLHPTSRPQDIHPDPPIPQPAILKLIPSEGPKSGGAEITVLGSNFTNDGLEVYFGSQKAITTTYWGPTSLVCYLPPSPVAGPVPVTIGHPGRRHVVQPPLFTYRDDDEDQLIRTALGVLAGQYNRDPAGFARSILYAQNSVPGSNNQAPHGNGGSNFNHFRGDSSEDVESNLLRMLEVTELDESAAEAQINIRQPSGQTMLHLASSLGFARFVAALLLRGANVHLRDKGGFTPLHMAVMNDHPEIVRRLIAKGADINVQSRSGLKPIDLARSVPVRRSLHYFQSRATSVDSRPSRPSSSLSMQSHWEPSPVMATDIDDSCEEAAIREDRDRIDTGRGGFIGPRRRSTVETHEMEDEDEGPASTAMMAVFREQVAAQLHQLQHTMTVHLQSLSQLQMPNIQPLSGFQDYHSYLPSTPVMQRITSLVPNIRGQRQEPTGEQSSNPGDNKWAVFPFFGYGDSPPAYGELFPQKDIDTKQASAAQAAAEYEADAKCATLFDQDMAKPSQVGEVPTLLQIGRKHLITKEQQERLQRAHAERLKAGSSDKMLWFVWIPILVLVLGAMLWSGAPSLISGTASAAKALASFAANPREFSNQARRIVQELA